MHNKDKSKTFHNGFFVHLKSLADASASSKESTWRDGPFPHDVNDPKLGRLTLVPSDLVLLDTSGPYYDWVELYAVQEEKFFLNFAQAYFKLLHVGTTNLSSSQWWTSSNSTTTDQ